jgi:hypothetical protein
MPDNYEFAVARLISSESRLKKLAMEKFVCDQFAQQIKDGWLIEVSRDQIQKFPRRNFVYGFLTFNNNKKPPKPRWVNDTASTFKGVSLNKMLMKGPDNTIAIQQSMFAFREGAVAYQADVKSMFNQTMLREEDQYSQLCLWRDCDASSQPRIYRQTRIIFGPSPSPCLTSAVRIHHAKKYENTFPEGADVAQHQMYVDDAGDSRDDVKTAVKVAKDLIKMHEDMSWPLIEFYSNSREFLNGLPPESVGKKLLEIGDATDNELISKMLGMFWRPVADVYIFRLNDDRLLDKMTADEYTATKREMLGTLMKIYDPLGFLIPFRMRGFIIMQKVWRAGTDWKQKPPKELADEFREWLREFATVAKLEIPRCYAAEWKLKDCELSLHILVDASTEACCAVGYLRIKKGNDVRVRFIMAKGRVSPVKYMSVPKLEITACLIGARLLRTIMKWHRRLTFVDYKCWTDSLTCFRWIRSPHLPKTPFTAPRVAEIQDITSADKWRYVPTKQNTSDYGTKAREMDYGNNQHEFYVGPTFLYLEENEWPKQPDWEKQEEETPILAMQKSDDAPKWQLGVIMSVSPAIRKCWMKYVIVVAIALRAADKWLKRKVEMGHIKGHEYRRAEHYIIRLVQVNYFGEEYRRLSLGKAIEKGEKISSLNPFLCEATRLIRVRTRMPSAFPLDMRSPPLLPNFHEVSDSIALHHHEMQMHVNDNAIQASIRSRVWIISTRRIVTRIRARCLFCMRKKAQKSKPPEFADLPEFRFDINSKPFFHTGADFFGPYVVYVGNSHQKKMIQVVLFTCMVTRAVFMEAMNDLSTESFMCVLEKLWARRGPILHIYCDNAKTFHAAGKILGDPDFHDYINFKGTNFHHIPAFTPSFGGAWERLIKDTKRALDASIGKHVVREVIFVTALAKIETNINDRPLTNVPIRPDEDAPITPYRLMNGYANHPMYSEHPDAKVPELNDIEKKGYFKKVRELVTSFRSRFISEYGPIITRRATQKESIRHQLNENDMVVYLDKTKPPSQWPIGHVIKVYRGPDRKIRVVDVQLKGGELLPKRSSRLLAKIDVKLENCEAEQKNYEENKFSSSPENSEQQGGTQRQEREIRANTLEENSAESTQEQREEKLKARTKKMNQITKLFDDDLTVNDQAGGIVVNPKLTDQQAHHFFLNATRRTIVASNLPACMGFSELFQAFEHAGRIVMITCSSWNGEKPFRALITFTNEFEVKRLVKFDRSLAIVIEGKAHTVQFETLRKPFNPERSCHNTKIVLINLKSRSSRRTCQALLITNGKQRTSSHHDAMPIFGDSAGFLFRLPADFMFVDDEMLVNMQNINASMNRQQIAPKPDSSTATNARDRINEIAIRTVDVAPSHDDVIINSNDADMNLAIRPVSENDVRHVINRRRANKRAPNN